MDERDSEEHDHVRASARCTGWSPEHPEGSFRVQDAGRSPESPAEKHSGAIQGAIPESPAERSSGRRVRGSLESSVEHDSEHAFSNRAKPGESGARREKRTRWCHHAERAPPEQRAHERPRIGRTIRARDALIRDGNAGLKRQLGNELERHRAQRMTDRVGRYRHVPRRRRRHRWT